MLKGGTQMQQIHLISPPQLLAKQLVERIMSVHQLATFIHIRQKTWTKFEVEQCIDELIYRGVPKAKIIVNTYADIAETKQLGGVHLPEQLEITEVKKAYPTLTIGTSVHTLASALHKEAAGADYVIFGHVFPTESKPGLRPQGLQALEKITRHLSIPVIAIGGIQPHNIHTVETAGAKGVAVLSYVLLHDDPVSAINQLRKREVQT